MIAISKGSGGLRRRKIMGSILVEILWDEKELGENWMNIDNLKSCLFGKTHTTEELCQVRVVSPEKQTAARGEPDD